MADFNSIVKHVLKVEAGYQALPSDTGNYNSRKELVGTNRGISAPVYEAWIKRPPTAADMRAITEPIALAIYKKNFWGPIQGDAITNPGIAHFLFDFYVNSGSWAMYIMRRALRLPETKVNITAPEVKLLNNLTDPGAFLDKYKQARLDFVNSSTKISDDLKKGLRNRIEEVYSEVKKKYFPAKGASQGSSLLPGSQPLQS